MSKYFQTEECMGKKTLISRTKNAVLSLKKEIENERT